MTESARVGFKSAADLPDEVAVRLGDLLLSLADNKRLLGIRYSDWILGAPSVEAGIACSAMAQDEWGHARILYAMLRDFGHDPSALEHERPSGAYRNSELLDRDVSSWPEFLALNFLWDTALSVQFEMLAESRFEPIHYKVRKLLEEERFHFDHGQGWTLRLLAAEGGRKALAEAFEAAWNACLCWFGPDGDPLGSTLTEHGIVGSGPAGARRRWLQRVGPLVSKVGLTRAAGETWISTRDPAWGGRCPERRRAVDGGPDEDSLARVRGDRNRALLMD
ncbi:1,2-phenylacetyl-CoA epoxidase subunit PaaC [Candidatus Palauibacter sp.]|uniref:1,2-phenylacetyl-CoA epoxidase subunit PaaC n=1 Tax=Candidatus Palauibacter sp. TaxID=3101350 RepID=UPI003CC544BF